MQQIFCQTQNLLTDNRQLLWQVIVIDEKKIQQKYFDEAQQKQENSRLLENSDTDLESASKSTTASKLGASSIVLLRHHATNVLLHTHQSKAIKDKEFQVSGCPNYDIADLWVIE